MRIPGELAIDVPGEGGPSDGRRAPRARTRVDARMRRREGKLTPVIVLDLAIYGFRAETAGLFQAGAQVWLKLPGLEAALATIAWTDDIRIGAEFVQPLHPAVVERIVAQAEGG
ncbi:MAG TPA: PilZ domain-containing protein [Sphingomonadaceae bacterium]|nr:PilZ domain-containing protein [Sphingomonadaceae bacterium]